MTRISGRASENEAPAISHYNELCPTRNIGTDLEKIMKLQVCYTKRSILEVCKKNVEVQI